LESHERNSKKEKRAVSTALDNLLFVISGIGIYPRRISGSVI
jgi:hypothetical protein